MSYKLRTLSAGEAGALYDAHMKADFPASERPHRHTIVSQVEQGLLTAFEMTDGLAAYAYALAVTDADYVLYTHLAVFPQHRGGGHGTRLLSLLGEAFAGVRVELLEVENPDAAQDPAERRTRERRIAFYQRAGYAVAGGLRYVLFGVDMWLMTRIHGGEAPRPEELIPQVQAFYHKLLEPKYYAEVEIEAL